MNVMRGLVMALLVLTGAAIPAAEWLTAKPAIDREHAALRDFIVALGPLTHPGERIALIVPVEDRDQDTLGYRARYLLPGRIIVLDARGADAVAYWRVPPPPGGHRQAVAEGTLVR